MFFLSFPLRVFPFAFSSSCYCLWGRGTNLALVAALVDLSARRLHQLAQTLKAALVPVAQQLVDALVNDGVVDLEKGLRHYCGWKM